MKKALVLLLALFTCVVIHAQTVTTNTRCHFLSNELGLSKLYEVTLEEAKIGTIPKGKTLIVLGIDTIKGNLIKVQYKNKIGWIHRTVVKDQFVINYQLKLTEVSLNGIKQEPHTTESMYYEDNTIAIKWSKGIDKMIFILHNKSNRSISINWNNSSWVGTDLKAEKFMHSGVKYINKDEEQANTIIPPNSRIDEIVLPNSSVYFDDYLGWRNNSLLIFTAKHKAEIDNIITQHLEQSIKVLLSIEQGDSKYEYNFSFDLDTPVIKEITANSKLENFGDDTYF